MFVKYNFYYSLNKLGSLNGFGWHFNADLTSNRYEYPHGRSTTDQGFFQETPNWLYDPSKHGRISTMHIYLDSTPQLNFC